MKKRFSSFCLGLAAFWSLILPCLLAIELLGLMITEFKIWYLLGFIVACLVSYGGWELCAKGKEVETEVIYENGHLKEKYK